MKRDKQYPRPIKVLLELLLKEVKQGRSFYTNGLCLFTDDLSRKEIITDNEYYILIDYLKTNVPTHMWRYRWWKFIFNDNFWFNPRTRTPRIKYLENRIKHESK
jgi:hypothetical protein